MKSNNHGATPVPTKEHIKRAAVRCVHTYEGATADEWQDQAHTLCEGDGGDEGANGDAVWSQRVADALHELDEESALRMQVAGEKTAHPISLAMLWVTLGGIKEQLDNVAIPLGHHLSLEDPELMMAMEELSGRINSHVEKFDLVAERRRPSNGLSSEVY